MSRQVTFGNGRPRPDGRGSARARTAHVIRRAINNPAAVPSAVIRTLFPAIEERRRAHRHRSATVTAALWNVEITRVINRIIAEYGLYVRSGPFKGMMYWPVNAPGHEAGGLASCLLGAYECELHDVIEDLTRTDYEQIINVGCAEGYYAVGLALRFPRAHVHAFDIVAKARRVCEGLATVNGVADRVTVHGECTHDHLRQLIEKRSLIVTDCEGYELELLRPDLVPGLSRCDMVVELHDFIYAGLTGALVPRFADTHRIRMVDTEARDPAAFGAYGFLTVEQLDLALNELRPCPMQWAVMKALRP